MAVNRNRGSVGKDAAAAATLIVHGRVNKLMRAVALEAHGRIVQRTPVDMGTARANWNTSTNAPDLSTDPSAGSGEVAGKASAARTAIAEVGFAEGERLFVANGLPYIERLEHGYSKQAPTGMVVLTVAEMQPLVEKLAREVSRVE